MWGRRWLAQLGTQDPQLVESAIDAVHATPSGQRLERDVVRRALAACEVVAASSGRPAAALPSNARRLATDFVERLRPLRARARAALERIRAERGPDADPADRYDEPDAATEQADADSADWRTRMDLLSMRLAD